MNIKKILKIILSIVIGIMVIGAGTFFVMLWMKSKTMKQNAKLLASNYVEAIRVGKLEDAYKMLSPNVKAWLEKDEYVACMEAYIDEEKINFKIDDNRQESLEKEMKQKHENYIALAKKLKNKERIAKAESYSKIDFTYVPVDRIVTKTIGGKSNQVTERFDLTIVYKNDKPYIHTNSDEFYTKKMEIVFGKAFDYIEDCMEYEGDEKRISKNSKKIVKYINTASVIPEKFRFKNEASLELSIVKSFHQLILKDYEESMMYLEQAEGRAITPDQKVRVRLIESEIYIARGEYSKSVKKLQEALSIQPDNKEVSKDYRRVSSMMIDKMESNLADGWAQLKSSLSQDITERKRILKDIAIKSANDAIKVKSNAPDGYFLRGSIKYAQGNSSGAIEDLEKALSLAEEDDTIFRTEVAQVLGLARTSEIRTKVVRKKDEDGNLQEVVDKALEAYKSIIKTDVRSILIREAKVGSLIDSVKR